MTAGALRVLADRLTEFGRHQLSDPAAHAVDIAPTSGHAGLSYTFRFVSGGMSTPYFLRLPPAGVRLEGTADVLRQVCALNALNATAVPHAGVVWSGDDAHWFGVPYFITEWLDGVTLDLTERVAALSDEELQTAGRQAVEGLVGLRAVPWQQSCGYLAPVADLEAAITRWDRFYERAADRDVLLHLGPVVRRTLLRRLPENPHIGLCHGDYQFGNLIFSRDRRLRAVIDWELCSLGPTLRDLGWLVAFHDRLAWGPALRPMAHRLTAADLLLHWPAEIDSTDLPWFEAFALYQYAIISGFNLMLHRRGKRPDPSWEWRSSSAPYNLQRALQILG